MKTLGQNASGAERNVGRARRRLGVTISLQSGEIDASARIAHYYINYSEHLRYVWALYTYDEWCHVLKASPGNLQTTLNRFYDYVQK